MKCSIVLTTINKPEYLGLTLTRIIQQITSFDLEIIVVNDGCDEKTIEVCKSFAWAGVTTLYTHNTKYRNPSIARNVGYRFATGEVIVSTCDDILQLYTDTLERLVTRLQPGTFRLAKTENWLYDGETPIRYLADYCSTDKRPVPYFFLGALYRSDLYAVGGNDEEFVEVCYDDNWFADCLIKGLGLTKVIDDDIVCHHRSHLHPKNSHVNEKVSHDLYISKVREANRTGIWQASGGAWSQK